jgi:hypothetical protein
MSSETPLFDVGVTGGACATSGRWLAPDAATHCVPDYDPRQFR